MLPNGVGVGGINQGAPFDASLDGWLVDANGKAGPNVVGHDGIRIVGPKFNNDGSKNPGCYNRRIVCWFDASPWSGMPSNPSP
jgi:hypothetical protein